MTDKTKTLNDEAYFDKTEEGYHNEAHKRKEFLQMTIYEALRKKVRTALTLGLAACLVGGIAGTEFDIPHAYAAVNLSSQSLTASESSLQPIAGAWREAGDPEPRVLTIYADGTYELVYPEGKAFGTVKVTPEEHLDGSKSLWYSFYEEGGLNLEDAGSASPWYSAYTSANKLWAAFAKDEGALTQVDLRTGHDGTMHFVRGWENDFHKTSKGVKADDYLGIWGCGRCTATVSREGAGYLVEIQWASNAAEGSRWVYHCTYDNDAAILFSNSRSNGTRIDYAYSEDSSVSDQMIYNDGEALFVLRNNTLTWQDKKENAGEDMEFFK